MPVIAPFELDYFASIGIAARQSHRAHQSFRARAYKAHHFNGGHRLHEYPGKFDFSAVGAPKGNSVGCSILYSFDHRRMRVAQYQQYPRAHVIDERVAVLVEHAAPFPALDEDRISADTLERAHRTIDPSGDKLACDVV